MYGCKYLFRSKEILNIRSLNMFENSVLIKKFGLLAEKLNGSSKKLQDEESNEWYLLTDFLIYLPTYLLNYILHEVEYFLKT